MPLEDLLKKLFLKLLESVWNNYAVLEARRFVLKFGNYS
jgi:hypothetical protein